MTEYFKQIRTPDGSLYSVLDEEAARINHTHNQYITQTAADQRYMSIDADIGEGYLTKTAADDYYATKTHSHSEYLTSTAADNKYLSIDTSINTTTGAAVTSLSTASINKVTENATVTVVTGVSTTTSSVGVVNGVSTTTGSASYISAWNAGDAPIKSVSTASINKVTEISTTSFDIPNFKHTLNSTTVYGENPSSSSTQISENQQDVDSFNLQIVNPQLKRFINTVSPISVPTSSVSDGILSFTNTTVSVGYETDFVYGISNITSSKIEISNETKTAVSNVTTAAQVVATGGTVGTKPSLTYTTITPVTSVSTTSGTTTMVTGVSTTTAQVSKITTTAQTIATGANATAAFVKSVNIE